MKQRLQILVADDEPIVRRSLRMLLEHDGNEVCAVDNGEAALAQLTERRFDVVITDFSMPGMQGDQLVARIRQVQPDQPIIMSTAFVEEYKVFGQAFGSVDALLFKPFTLKELREAIDLAMARVRPQHALFLPTALQPLPATGCVPPTQP